MKAHLKAIRQHLEENGFRWCCYINGDHVVVDLPGIEYEIRTMKQADWLIRRGG
jgi:hypothetical protein